MNPKWTEAISLLRSTLCGILSLAGGCYAAIWIFGAAFFAESLPDFRHGCLVPLLALFAGSALLVLLQPPAKLFVVIALTAPSLLLQGCLFVGLLDEGRAAWEWLQVAVLVAVAVLAGCSVGLLLTRRLQRRRGRAVSPNPS